MFSSIFSIRCQINLGLIILWLSLSTLCLTGLRQLALSFLVLLVITVCHNLLSQRLCSQLMFYVILRLVFRHFLYLSNGLIQVFSQRQLRILPGLSAIRKNEVHVLVSHAFTMLSAQVLMSA